MNERSFYAETYDVCVQDWPGEIDFYCNLIRQEVEANNGTILELACGTGRVAIQLTKCGKPVVGLDRSPEMLEIARRKGINSRLMRWVEGDMRSFSLQQTFDLILIPGHSFQNLNTSKDQRDCLLCVMEHLNPGGVLIVHVDHINGENLKWLGKLTDTNGSKFDTAENFIHPRTGNHVQTYRAWSCEPATQTAIVQTAWEEHDADSKKINRIETGEVRLHCLFRFEMEHLLNQSGLEIMNVYGDFYKRPLTDTSEDMIWIARK